MHVHRRGKRQFKLAKGMPWPVGNNQLITEILKNRMGYHEFQLYI